MSLFTGIFSLLRRGSPEGVDKAALQIAERGDIPFFIMWDECDGSWKRSILFSMTNLGMSMMTRDMVLSRNSKRRLSASTQCSTVLLTIRPITFLEDQRRKIYVPVRGSDRRDMNSIFLWPVRIAPIAV